MFKIRNETNMAVATSDVDWAHEILLVCPPLVGGARRLNLPFARVHVATPNDTLTRYQTYFGISSLGAAFVILAANLGFASCCVRDGRDMYGLSCCDALHS